MLLLDCPNCGARNASEFRFGGEVNPRPRTAAVTAEAEWARYLYLRENKSDVQTEWWYHRTGCGLWFLAERHTSTNRVLRTFLWHPKPEDELASGN
jgi:heterotetrameric sarcosine oxidase delta subunit